MNVVSNASPIIFLSKLDALDLLQQCFNKIEIPQAVSQEIGELALPSYITITPISEAGSQYVAGAIGALHTGELEAMVLSRETKADYILLDDLAARRKATRMGLSIIGTIGIIALANAKKHLTATTTHQYYDALVEEHGLYLSAEILQQVKNENPVMPVYGTHNSSIKFILLQPFEHQVHHHLSASNGQHSRSCQ